MHRIEDELFIDALRRGSERTGLPAMSTRTVADVVGCAPVTAYARLCELEERGMVRRLAIHPRTILWGLAG